MGDGPRVNCTLGVDERVALYRYLMERRGVGEREASRLWRFGVVANAAMGVLVGVWMAWSRWTGDWGIAAAVFAISTTVFWLVSGGATWALRRLMGGRAGDIERALIRARAAIEREHATNGDLPYELCVTDAGVRERWGGDERLVPWTETEGAEVWTVTGVSYAAVRTSDGLAMVARDETDTAPAFVRAVEDRLRD